jgi:hypothetical protein
MTAAAAQRVRLLNRKASGPRRCGRARDRRRSLTVYYLVPVASFDVVPLASVSLSGDAFRGGQVRRQELAGSV